MCLKQRLYVMGDILMNVQSQLASVLGMECTYE
jgi:hypothetical protein